MKIEVEITETEYGLKITVPGSHPGEKFFEFLRDCIDTQNGGQLSASAHGGVFHVPAIEEIGQREEAWIDVHVYNG